MLNFIPRMNSETLLEGYKDILKAIYAVGPRSTGAGLACSGTGPGCYQR
jgi:hypothetical protein